MEMMSSKAPFNPPYRENSLWSRGVALVRGGWLHSLRLRLLRQIKEMMVPTSVATDFSFF